MEELLQTVKETDNIEQAINEFKVSILATEADKELAAKALCRLNPMMDFEFQLEVFGFAKVFPLVSTRFHIVDRIGEGTFSTVFKAVDNEYDSFRNDEWKSITNARGFMDNFPDGKIRKKRAVALKRIFVNSSPSRIENEVRMLQTLRGSDYVIPLITAFRNLDQVVLVMPHFDNDDFRICMHVMSLEDIKCYLISLFRALEHVHECGIVHRDVKPSNFLWDMKSRRGVLVDFGLAEWMDDNNENGESTASEDDERIMYRAKDRKLPKRNPGIYTKDTRPAMNASRAGTRGFRAPEVLFKVRLQTTALDIWSAGVILLSLLTRQFPFFNSQDDQEALVELGCIFGTRKMEAAAALYKRRWRAHVPSMSREPVSWYELVDNFNPCFIDSTTPKQQQRMWSFLDGVFDMWYDARLTATAALAHPLLAQSTQ